MLREAAAFEVSISNQSKESENAEEDANPFKKAKLLTTEEKTQMNREKNREHARNTRKRKKIFIAKLKEMVDLLRRQTESERKERIDLGKHLADMQQLHHHLVKVFLNYRANNVQDRQAWQAICTDSFTLTLPITPYRYYHKTEVNGSQRVVVGLDALIIDTASVAIMTESIGLGNPSWMECLKRGQGCKMSYLVHDRSIISSGNIVACGFHLLCESHHLVGVHDINMRGMLRCQFNSAHLLESMELVFDVMGFMQQFQRAAMLDPQRTVIPNTIHLARLESRDARIIASFDSPHPVLSVNAAYWAISGRSSPSNEDLVAYTLLDLLAEFSPPHNGFMSHASWSQSLNASLDLVKKGFPVRYHYPKHLLKGSLESCLVYLQIFPLFDNDSFSSVLVTLREIPMSMGSVYIPLPNSQGLSASSSSPYSPPLMLDFSSTPAAVATWSYPLLSQQLQMPPMNPASVFPSNLHLPHSHESTLVTAITGTTTPMIAHTTSSAETPSSPSKTGTAN